MKNKLLALLGCFIIVALSIHLDTAISAAPPFPVPPESLPASYDLRTFGKVTPVKAPECGTCWTAATMGSLESFLMPFENWDFSEDHMQTFVNGPNSCNGGGASAIQAMAYLAGWYGPVKETDYDYTLDAPQNPDVQKHVQRVYYLPEKPVAGVAGVAVMDHSWTKYAIMNLGAVYQPVSMSGAPITNHEFNTFYLPEDVVNHAVTLVGWDDNFPAYKFTYKPIYGTHAGQTLTPPGPGAFIAKSNGGPTFGENGYYYISYYDGTILNNSGFVFTAESVDNYVRIYQYDGAAGDAYPLNAIRFANVFTADANEDLAAVSFYGDLSSSLDYLIQIYLDPAEGVPVGEDPPVATVITQLPMAGYYTVKLPKKVHLTQGQKFSVVLSLGDPGNSDGVYVQVDVPRLGQTKVIKGRGFVKSYNGEWSDMVDYRGMGANLCIKAFTTKQSPILMNAVRRFGPDMYRLAWDFTNTTSSPIQVKPVAYLYKKGQVGFQRMAGEITGEYYLTDSGRRIKMNGGILQLAAQESVTVISRPGINDVVQKVASNAYILQDSIFKLVDTWRYHDLFTHPIFVLSTNPSSGAMIPHLSLNTITVTFDTEIRTGPNLAGITVMSPEEKKFTFNTISGKTLTLTATSPFGLVGVSSGNTAEWQVRIPKDAVQDAFGNRMEKDFIFNFKVTGAFQYGVYD